MTLHSHSKAVHHSAFILSVRVDVPVKCECNGAVSENDRERLCIVAVLNNVESVELPLVCTSCSSIRRQERCCEAYTGIRLTTKRRRKRKLRHVVLDEKSVTGGDTFGGVLL